MFEVAAKIYRGHQLVKYEVLDLSTGVKKIMSVEMVLGMAMTDGLVNAKFNKKTGTLTGINGFNIRTLPKRYEKLTKDSSSFYLYGSRLLEFVNNEVSLYSRERYLVDDIMNFLNNSTNGKICALYGLEGTGKTVMMLHAIKRLFNAGIKNIAFVSLAETDSLASLFENIKKFADRGIRYIFLDEITAVDGFIQCSATLADIYAKMGIHIVITGRDSYLIHLASQNNLYDRLLKINTTYIGYKEYCYINPNATILDYIRTGGVLPAEIFYDNEKTKNYINTAISDNIIHSLVKANNTNQHQRLLELNEHGLLKKAIEQTIEALNEPLIATVIAKNYKNAALDSEKQLMEQIFDIDEGLDIEEIEEIIEYKLSVMRDLDSEIHEDYIEELQYFLADIGVVKMYHRCVCIHEYIRKVDVPIFVQPGLRYHQTLALLNSLCETTPFSKIEKKVRVVFLEKLIKDLESNLIEHEAILSKKINDCREKFICFKK